MSAPKKQTAVQWLEKEFVKLESTIGIYGVMYELIEQAKAMEKEQIKKDFIAGMEFIPVDPNRYNEDADQYYNETYKQKQ